MAYKLIVIGNGFDLSAGGKTSYKNYFESDYYEETHNNVKKWTDYCLSGRYKGKSLPLLFPDESKPFNCWDLLFFMRSSELNSQKQNLIIRNWCDIERVIHNSLTQEDRRERSIFSWQIIYERLHEIYQNPYIEGKSYPELPEHNIMLKFLLDSGWREKCSDSNHFYALLLDELKSFERTFGLYISSVTQDNTDYQYIAKRNVERLGEHERDIRIDSFNYSDFDGYRIRHINGDADNPIFGIDLSQEEQEKFPEARSFTKTSRRLQQDVQLISDLSKDGVSSVSKAVVFGHSLNDMDFDYFNYLFTMLKFNTFDISEMRRIDFVYKAHTDNPDTERLNYADRVYHIINRYEKYVSSSNQHILINMLRFSGKMRIWEL